MNAPRQLEISTGERSQRAMRSLTAAISSSRSMGAASQPLACLSARRSAALSRPETQARTRAAITSGSPTQG